MGGVIIANPQKENGFTPIANEIMDALCKVRIPGEVRQIFDYILRQTYGWNRQETIIPLSKFTEATNIKKPNVIRSINTLVKMNLIIVGEKSVIKIDNGLSELITTGSTYRFNKDYESWNSVIKTDKALSKLIKKVIKTDNPKIFTSSIKEKKEIAPKRPKPEKQFIPPTLQDVKSYFTENGYKLEIAEKAFRYYSVANWKDSKGNQIRNWKQKMIAVWFKDENKALPAQKSETLTWEKAREMMS